MFEPVSDAILNAKTVLTVNELRQIEHSIAEVNAIIDQCGPNDTDVLDWHIVYMTRCMTRVNLSYNLLKSRG